jgi:hypothetical protein
MRGNTDTINRLWRRFWESLASQERFQEYFDDKERSVTTSKYRCDYGDFTIKNTQSLHSALTLRKE